MEKDKIILKGILQRFDIPNTQKRIYRLEDYLPMYFFIAKNRNKKFDKILK